MARYFFDFSFDDRVVLDDRGLDYATLSAAGDDAVLALTAMAMDYMPFRSQMRSIAVAVRDRSGRSLLRISLDMERQSLH